MEEVMTVPMTVDSPPSLAMNVDMAINVASGSVYSVNGQTGDVILTAEDVGALSDSTEIPTKTSDLQNDSGFITSIPAEYVTDSELQTAISGKANTADLATVATSGNYNDLTNKPTIPTVNNATLTIQKNGTTVKTFTANASSNVTANITVPTTASDVGAIALPNNPATGAFLVWNGSAWVAQTLSTWQGGSY